MPRTRPTILESRGIRLLTVTGLGLLAAPGALAEGRLEEAYARWVERQEAAGGLRNLALRLGWSKAYSQEPSEATGVALVDWVDRRITLEIQRAGADPGDVWLVDNRAGRSAAPDRGDRQVRLGSLDPARRDTAVLSADLAELPADFELDLVVVTRPGGTPESAGVLFGSPGLWQRRYVREATGGHSDGDRRGRRRRGSPHPARVPSFDPLVQRGAELFFEETFGGNGRTCGTCHPAGNNFTIDPDFIATLPDDDPLFVAEFDPRLAEDFEKPELMRQLGLILENTDGFGDLANRFTMRGVPHTLALPTSLRAAADFPLDAPTGWSGDGAPNGGSLRQFANGAIRQHFPRSTARVENVDFRFATDEELDALEAFQLFLGRAGDPDITPGSPGELRFRSPLAERGKQLFNDTDSFDGSAGKCVNCHDDAGANSLFSGTNDNFDTGVESLPESPADRIAAELGDPSLAANPPDDGFGSPGDGTFNTPTLVEAADTPPFFHDNSVATLEEAIDFYNSEAFADSPAGQFLAANDPNGVAIRLDAPDVAAVAALLRVLNALENVRSAVEYADFVARHDGLRSARELLEISLAEAADARQVLEQGGLHPEAVERLGLAEESLAQAAQRSRGRARLASRALRFLEAVPGMLRSE